MAIIKAVSSRASIATALRYVTKTEKTDEKLITGLNCSPDTVIDEMKMTKQLWGKTGGRQYKHYIQSFPPDENITPETAHEIAVKFAEKFFKGFEVLAATHIDREHTHSHFIINSVNFENGYKLQESAADLQARKEYSNELCRQYGLSVPEKSEEITSAKGEKYKALENAITGGYKSYILDCYNAVKRASANAVSRNDFIELLRQEGYETNWSESRKHITFTDGYGNKIRNSNLSKTFKENFGKEDLENGFESNLERERARTQSAVERFKSNGNGTDDIGAVIDNLNSAIANSNADVKADDGNRANRIADETRRRREQDRIREREARQRERRYERSR